MKRIVAVSTGVLVSTTLVVGLSSGAFARQKHHSTLATVKSVTPNHGPLAGGTLVDIKGTNLVSASVVEFGSNLATNVIPRSNHLVQAVAPAGTGTVDVRVTTNTGTSAVSAGDKFSYVTTPTIQSVRPPIGSIAGGNQVTISGSGFSGVSSVDFGSTAASRFVVDSPDAITAVTPPHGAGTVDVTVSLVGGAASPMDSADHYKYVNRVPVVTSVVFDVGSQAGGDVVTITGQLFSSPATVYFGAPCATTTPTCSTQSPNVVVKNSTTILATSPPGTGTVEITVDTSKGASALHPPIDDYMYSATGP
jgi:hypothetical protein